MYAVGIDLGTTGCKAVIADKNGTIISQEYIEYPLIVKSSVMVEQDANLWWELSCKAVSSAVSKSGLAAKDMIGISVSSQGISFVLTDEYMNPLGNAISWLDIRASDEVLKIKDRYTEEKIFKLTGKRISETYVLPKLLWLKKHSRENMRRTHKILMAHDFLVAKMTGGFYTDHTMAGGTLLYDVANRCWCKELLREFHLNEELLPEIKNAGALVGNLSETAATKMGLTTDTKVTVGGQDQKMAAYYVEPDLNTATLCLGTACAMEFLCSSPTFDKNMRIPLFCYITEDCWTLESVISTAGASLKWLKNTLFKDLSYPQLDSLAEKAEAGSGGIYFYPHFGGATSPHWDSSAKGMFYGLSLNSSREDIIRSVLEGIAFQIKTNLIVCEEIFSEKEKIIVFGSGAKSELWCQIITDVTGKSVYSLSTTDASGLGAAKLAFLSTTDIRSFQENDKKESKRYLPCTENVHVYEKIYQDYLMLEKKILT